MKVLLVYPPYEHGYSSPPLGLMCIASVLENAGHDVQIIDCTFDKLPGNFDKYDLVGVSFTSQLVAQARTIIDEIKTVSPNVKVIVGGPHTNSFGKDVFRDIPKTDFACVGEGEYTMLDLANKTDPEKIKGLLWKDKADEVHINEPRPFIETLDELPFPARHLISLENYSEKGAMITSRGCPFRCVFCSKWTGRTYRAHSAKYVLSEMKEMIEKYHITSFYIQDDNFVANPQRASHIADGIVERGWNVRINLGNGIRVDSIARNEELISKLAKSGLRNVSLGVESISQEVLDATCKDITVEQVEKAIDILRKNKIEYYVFLVVGLPKDKLENVEKTKKWIKKNHIKNYGVSLCTPYPNTDLWDFVNKNGVWLKKFDTIAESYSWHNLKNVYPIWETPDFPAVQRMNALLELRRFSIIHWNYINFSKIMSSLKHPQLFLWWFTKWLSDKKTKFIHVFRKH